MDIGKLGENIGSNYLIQLGWKILLRNYRRKSDEIDIIAKSTDGTLVFVEVKSLVSQNLSTFHVLKPEDNLTQAKLRKITRTCEFFARKHPELINEDRGWRIDLLAIDVGGDGRPKDIRHYENV